MTKRRAAIQLEQLEPRLALAVVVAGDAPSQAPAVPVDDMSVASPAGAAFPSSGDTTAGPAAPATAPGELSLAEVAVLFASSHLHHSGGAAATATPAASGGNASVDAMSGDGMAMGAAMPDESSLRAVSRRYSEGAATHRRMTAPSAHDMPNETGGDGMGMSMRATGRGRPMDRMRDRMAMDEQAPMRDAPEGMRDPTTGGAAGLAAMDGEAMEGGVLEIDAAESMSGSEMAAESGETLDTLLAGWTSGHDVDAPAATDAEARDAVLVAANTTISPELLAQLQSGVVPETRQVAQQLPQSPVPRPRITPVAFAGGAIEVGAVAVPAASLTESDAGNDAAIVAASAAALAAATGAVWFDRKAKSAQFPQRS
jgi:hypothetical protein